MADGATTPIKTFDWTDPLDLNGRLTEDERMIYQAAHDYARERLLPRVVSAFAQTTLTGRLSNRFGQATMLAIGMAITVVCTGLQPLAAAGWVTVVLMATMSLGQSVAFPNASAMISRTTDPDRQGQMLGLNNASGALARVLGPMVALNLFSSVNHDAPFIAGAAVVLPAIVLAISAGQQARKLGVRS